MESAQLIRREFWQSFSPAFHIGDETFYRGFELAALSIERTQELRASLKEEDYFRETIRPRLDLAAMTDTIRAMAGANLPPLFGFLYDEFWVPFLMLHPLLSSLLGGDYRLLPDFWIWNVDPARGNAGWRPHRKSYAAQWVHIHRSSDA